MGLNRLIVGRWTLLWLALSVLSLAVDGLFGNQISTLAIVLAVVGLTLGALGITLLAVAGSTLEVLDRLFGWKFGLPDAEATPRRQTKATKSHVLECVFIAAVSVPSIYLAEVSERAWPWALVFGSLALSGLFRNNLMQRRAEAECPKPRS